MQEYIVLTNKMNCSKKIQSIYRKCRRAKVISFDVFDTLVVRDVVNPNDVFSVIDMKTGDKKARYVDEYSTELLLECELSLCHPMRQMVDLAIRLKAEGRVVVLTSDMYLSGKKIEIILEHIGIRRGEAYDQLFVSSDYGCSKKDGGLYKKIQERYKIEYRDILHIGDAIRSDFLVPITMGIKSVLVRWENGDVYRGKRGNEVANLNRFIYNHTNGCDYEYVMGYKCFGPLLYGFSLWLNDKVPHDDTKVFFLSREGYIFLKALDEIGGRNENHKYMLISRRSINTALLWKYKNVEEMVRSLGINKAIRFGKILSLLGIDECADKDEYFSEFEDKMFSSPDEIITNSKVFDFICKYESNIIDNSRSQFDAIKVYLDVIGFGNGNKNVIVDIGWVGTMQRRLREFLDACKYSSNLEGFYLGVRTNNHYEDNKEGFLFNGDSIKKQRNYFSFVGLIESVLSEQEGSIKKYIIDGCNYRVDRCEYEYNKDDASKINNIQEGMLDFVKDMHNSAIREILCFDPFLASVNLLRLGNRPSKQDLDFYRSLDYSDESYDIGSTIKSRKFSLNSFQKELTNSVWKTAYLKCKFGSWFPAKIVYDALYCIKCK